MKKKSLLIASVGIIGLFLIMPFAQAASSQVWFSDTTEIYWRFTGETLDASLQTISLNSSYRKLNFTEVLDNPSNISIKSKIWDASSADVGTYGLTDPTIWVNDGLSLTTEIEDAYQETKYCSMFNELNADLTDISSITGENQTFVLMRMNIMTDPSFIAVFLVYILAMAFGATFGHNTNGTTITSVTERTILYDIDLDFSLEDGGGYNNITYASTVNLTYGVTSNVMLHSEVTSILTKAEWNGVGYDVDTLRLRYIHDIQAPSELLDDFPAGTTGGPSIPGYSIWILAGAMVLGIIPVYIGIKRKKK